MNAIVDGLCIIEKDGPISRCLEIDSGNGNILAYTVPRYRQGTTLLCCEENDYLCLVIHDYMTGLPEEILGIPREKWTILYQDEKKD